ncbi:MAG: hypothetical protein K2Y40_22415 [Reyranella sp.]|jgi:hypothetical protein|nr:hypothetical protein [Reyranella sp.]
MKLLGRSLRAAVPVLAVSLGACSRDYVFEGNSYSAPMTVAEIRKLYEARDACLAKNAVPADAAGNIDTEALAKAVSLSCLPQTNMLIAASNPDRDPRVAAAIRNDSELRALSYVLRARGDR